MRSREISRGKEKEMLRKKEDVLTVVVKDPGYAPRFVKVKNELPDLQELVGGYIETVSLYDYLVVICNEEGRLQGMPYNCELQGIGFVGTIVLAGTFRDEFASVPYDSLEALHSDYPELWEVE